MPLAQKLFYSLYTQLRKNHEYIESDESGLNTIVFFNIKIFIENFNCIFQTIQIKYIKFFLSGLYNA